MDYSSSIPLVSSPGTRSIWCSKEHWTTEIFYQEVRQVTGHSTVLWGDSLSFSLKLFNCKRHKATYTKTPNLYFQATNMVSFCSPNMETSLSGSEDKWNCRSVSSPPELLCCLKVIQLTLWPQELRRRWAVISLCLWRLHAVSVSLLQRNWYRLTLLSLTEPHHGLPLRSLTAVGLRVLSSRKITQACAGAHTLTHA